MFCSHRLCFWRPVLTFSSGSRCVASLWQRSRSYDLHWTVLAADPWRWPESDQQTGLSGWSQSAAAGGWQVGTHTLHLRLNLCWHFHSDSETPEATWTQTKYKLTLLRFCTRTLKFPNSNPNKYFIYSFKNKLLLLIIFMR